MVAARIPEPAGQAPTELLRWSLARDQGVHPGAGSHFPGTIPPSTTDAWRHVPGHPFTTQGSPGTSTEVHCSTQYPPTHDSPEWQFMHAIPPIPQAISITPERQATLVATHPPHRSSPP